MEHIRVNDKIRLEQLKLSMAPIIFEIIDKDRDYLKKWLPFIEHTNHVSDIEAFISQVSTENNKKDNIYAIWYREEFAGLIGFKDTDWVNKKTEIGYWLAKRMQYKGIVLSCTEKLIKFAFQKQNLNRIQIKVASGNTRSQAIPKKLGFVFEGTEREGELHQNKFLDLFVYSLLRKDYRS